jgi:LuxR family maltose regulon positive regulatory protein
MSMPVLTTKFYAPPLRTEWVSRPRLIQRLNDALDRSFSLISAPAGFGKTTLLSEWLRQAQHPSAWLSLDKGDNDPIRFWTYFINALQQMQPDLGEKALSELQSRQPPALEDILSHLINDLAADGSQRYVLVLDDFHLITAPRVHDTLVFLLDHMPPQLHLILATRADPPWPLARRRALGELTELRASDLRFTAHEAAAFLNEVMELDLSSDDVDALETRTEGWVTGLQMAAISMQARKRAYGARDVSAFVEAFAASNRFILDYLVEEVLDQQSAPVQDFLLRTSILDRMNAAVCDTVTERSDSQTILIQLEQANLFLVPLDDERRWYRYHHLFAQLLRTRLQQIHPQDIPILHHRASDWFEQHGLTVDAVNHALLAGDVARVGRLVTGNALAIMGHGELTALARWLETLPDNLMGSHPWLAISHAWVLAYAGQLSAVEARLGEVRAALEGLQDPAEAEHITGHIAAIRAYLTGLRGNMAQAAGLCRQALQLLPEGDQMARSFATSLLGSVLRWAGDLETAAQISNQAIALRQAAGDHRIAADAFCDLAALQLVQGRLREAATTCQDALRSVVEPTLAGSHASVAGFAHARMSAVLREWNELDAALRHAREGIALAEQWGWADGLVFGYGYLASALLASGDSDGALEAIQKGKRIASSLSPWLESQLAALQAQHWLARGNTGAAARWAAESGLSVDDPFGYENWELYFALARVLIAQGRRQSKHALVDRSLELLDRLLEMARGAGATGRVIEALVAQAMGLQALDRGRAALSALQQALTLAEPEGYMRVFIDQGEEMRGLLSQAATSGIAPNYVRELLAELEQETTDEGQTTEAIPASIRRAQSGLIEPLSERELQVLRLLTSNLSSPEMAEELFISPNTVRTHIKNIYQKLDVHSRSEAIERAHEVGLL